MLPNSEQTLTADFINLLLLTVTLCLTLNGFKDCLFVLNLQTFKQLEGRKQNVKHFYKEQIYFRRISLLSVYCLIDNPQEDKNENDILIISLAKSPQPSRIIILFTSTFVT